MFQHFPESLLWRSRIAENTFRLLKWLSWRRWWAWCWKCISKCLGLSLSPAAEQGSRFCLVVALQIIESLSKLTELCQFLLILPSYLRALRPPIFFQFQVVSSCDLISVRCFSADCPWALFDSDSPNKTYSSLRLKSSCSNHLEILCDLPEWMLVTSGTSRWKEGVMTSCSSVSGLSSATLCCSPS